MRTTRRVFTYCFLSSMFLTMVLVFIAPQPVHAATITVDPMGGGDYTTISDAITIAVDDDVIQVVPGTYVENLTLDKNIALSSTGTYTDTIIQGISGVGALGTLILTNSTISVTIDGFTIIGIDNDDPGTMNAAIYLQGSHSGTRIENNNIVANGDAGLLGEWSAIYDSITIDNNIFSGQTYKAPGPGGCGFASELTDANVPRQLVALGNGSGDIGTATATSITFTNNTITGTAGGPSIAAGCELYGQGNTLITLDAANSTITGNTFSGTTAGNGASLRVRRPGTTVSGNTFSGATYDGSAALHFVFENADLFTIPSFLAANTIDQGAYVNANEADGAVAATIPGGVLAASVDDTLTVLPGTYTGQVFIDKDLTLAGAGRDTTVIEATETMTSCYTTAYGHYSLVCVQNAEVTIDGFTIDGDNKGNVNNRFIGVDYHNASGVLSNCAVTGIRDDPLGSVLNGVGVYAYNESGSPVTFTAQSNIINEFQKNAMALNAAAGSPLSVLVESNIITGTGATSTIVQNGIQTYGVDVSGVISNNTVSGIAFVDSGQVATSILNYYADIQILNNTIDNSHMGIYNIDAPAVISGNTLEIAKIGNQGNGIIATDPPEAVPSPYLENGMLSPEQDMAIMAISASTFNVRVTGNTITFTGADNTYTYGIDAKAGYSANNIDFTATGNTVTGFDYGMSVWNCEGTCNTGIFTGVEVHLNNLSGNTIGLRNNFAAAEPANAVLNWYGAASGPSGDGPGSGSAVDGSLIFAPWCTSADCTASFVPAGTPATDIQSAFDWTPENAIFTFESGTFGGDYMISTPGLTLNLQGSTIGASSPAFTINAANTTIRNGILDGAGNASPGVFVRAAGDNLILDDLEIRNWSDGIEIETDADIDAFKVTNCWIHDNAAAGLHLNPGVAITGLVTIKGNLFKENGGMGIQDDSQISPLDATYNAWGHIDGPGAGDGVAGNVVTAPFTFSEVWVDMEPNTEATSRDVLKMEVFDVAVKVDAAKLYAVSYKLMYDPDFLTLNNAIGGDFAPSGTGTCTTDTSVPGIVDVSCSRIAPALEADGTLTITTLNFTADLSGMPDDTITWTTLFDLGTNKADLASAAKNGVKVFVNNGGFGAPSALAGRTITDANDGEISIITVGTLTGYIDLQARQNNSGATMKIYNSSNVASAIQYAIATSDSSGAYTATLLDSYQILAGGTYYVVFDAYLFLPTTPVDATTFVHSFTPTSADPYTFGPVLLLGGDATDDKKIDMNDISCIATDYGSMISTCARGSSDVNNDGKINLLDLALTGGNYGKTSSDVTLATPADTPAGATISLVPASGTFEYGDIFTIEVWANDVTDLYGVEVFLSFDPTHLQVQDADPGTAGVQVQPLTGFLSPDIVTHRSANNTTGTIGFVVTQSNPTPAVSGSGAVMSFDVKAISPDQTTISITDSMLVAWVEGSTGVEEIPATATGGTYTINNAEIYCPIILRNAFTGLATAYLPTIIRP